MAFSDITNNAGDVKFSEPKPDAPRHDDAEPTEGAALARSILKRIKADMPTVNTWRTEARKVDRFDALHHYSEAEETVLEQAGRPSAIFHAAQKWKSFVSGLEINSRLELNFLPRDIHNEAQQQEGELVTKFYEWALTPHGDDERSHAFERGLLRRGMGWTDTQFDRSIEVEGRIRVVEVDGLEMGWDHMAREPGLADARHVWRKRQIHKSAALKRYPKYRSVILANIGGANATDHPLESTLKSELSAVPQPEGASPTVAVDHVEVTEFQWWDEVEGVYFADPLEQKTDWMHRDEFNAYRAKYRKMVPMLRARAADPTTTGPDGQPLDPATRQATLDLPDDIEHDALLMREYKRVVMIGESIVSGPHVLPGNDRFTFNCMTGRWDETKGIYYGFYKILTDPQKYMTVFANAVLEIIQRGPKGGCYAEADAFLSIEQAEESNAKIGSITWLKPGGKEKILPKPPIELPAGGIEMFKLCMSVMSDVTGIDPSGVMGMGGADVPTTTVVQRQLAAQLILATEFASLRRYRINEALTILNFGRFVADDRWIRVGGAYDSQSLQLTKAPFAMKYDVVMEEGTKDPDTRRQVWRDLQPLMSTLINRSWVLPSVIDYMPFPPRLRHDLKEQVQRETDARQKQAEQGIQVGGRGKPTSTQELQARTEAIKAKTALDAAKAAKLTGELKQSSSKMILDGLIQALELDHKMGSEKANQQQKRVDGASKEAMTMAQITAQAQQRRAQ